MKNEDLLLTDETKGKSKKDFITEKQFESQVKDLAKVFHWRYYHTWRSIHSPAGFPDCVLVREKGDGTAFLLFFELKSEKGKITEAQEVWLSILSKVPGVGVYCFRPSDFDELVEVLK